MYDLPMMPPADPQKGSVFFYIILAILMLALLSFAVSRGSRFASSSLSADEARMAASEILTMTNTVGEAVQRLKLRGCTDTTLSFENTVSAQSYTNPGAPGDNSCHVFDTGGGKLNYQRIPDKALDPSQSGEADYADIYFNSGFQYENMGTTAADLALQISWLREEVCIAINNSLNIPNPAGVPPVENNGAGDLDFIGAYGPGNIGDTIGDDGAHDLAGRTGYCRYQSAVDNYQYNQILIAR